MLTGGGEGRSVLFSESCEANQYAMWEQRTFCDVERDGTYSDHCPVKGAEFCSCTYLL